MVTCLSSYFLKTLREDPVDAEVASHRLLVRAGYIRRQAAGLFAWLPLGLRVKRKLEALIRDEMQAAGASEVSFPGLLPSGPYMASGRWHDYGESLFRLQDRRGDDYLLAPTHEEAFTLLVGDIIGSHRDLPQTLYQIQDKFRDEARPRAGLLRAREFTMKDAYSFDVTDQGLQDSYQRQRDAYERIFTQLGLEYVVVAAAAGAMGGSRSEEFILPLAVGEDTFVRSAGGYAANIEAYRTPVPEPVPVAGQWPALVYDSPDTPTIASLVAHTNAVLPREDGREWQATDTLKNVVLALVSSGGTREVVIVGLPGDREVDLNRAEAWFGGSVEPATEEDLVRHPQLVAGYIGPVRDGRAVLGLAGSSGVRYLLDPRVVPGTSWLTGANEYEKHVAYLVMGRDFQADGTADIADVRAGDPAPDGSGPIAVEKGMELGHVFQLGTKYSEALGLQVLDADGRLVPVTMGSYGIGVSRLLAALAEVNHDDSGLIWPAAVAPFDVHLVLIGKDQVVAEVAGSLASQLGSSGLEVLFDDRARLSPGVKFSDAELIGIPNIVVVGRDAADGVVELWDRAAGTKEKVALSELSEVLTVNVKT